MTRTPSANYLEVLNQVGALMKELDRPPVVGISGHGGAGKSTLATRLMTDLGGRPEQVIRLDRLYAAGAGPHSRLFELHDWPLIFRTLRTLRVSPPATRLRYVGRTYEGVERSFNLSMPPVNIVEGIRLLRPEVLPLLDLAVWIDLSPELAGSRAVARNREQGDSDHEIDLWRTKWIPEANEYANLTKPEQLAQLVVPSEGFE